MLGTTSVSGEEEEAETEVEERGRLVSEVGVVWIFTKKKGRQVRGEGLERRANVGKERKKRDMAN